MDRSSAFLSRKLQVEQEDTIIDWKVMKSIVNQMFFTKLHHFVSKRHCIMFERVNLWSVKEVSIYTESR